MAIKVSPLLLFIANFLPVTILYLLMILFSFLHIQTLLVFLINPFIFPLFLGITNYLLLKKAKGRYVFFTIFFMLLAVITIQILSAATYNFFNKPRNITGNDLITIDILYMITGYMTHTWVNESTIVARVFFFIGMIIPIISGVVFLTLFRRKK